MSNHTTIKIAGNHTAEVKSTGIVHNLLRTGENDAKKRKEIADTKSGATLGDLWPK